MLSFMLTHKLDKIKEDGAVGDPPQADPAVEKSKTSPEEGGDKFDDHGYEKVTEDEGDKDKPESTKKEKAVESETSEKVEDPSTGYGAEPPEVDPEPEAEKTPAEKPAEADEYDKMVEGLPKEEMALFKEVAKKHTDPKEMLKAFVELRKKEFADADAYSKRAEKEAEREKQLIRAAWHKELKEDPAFGGDKFDRNVTRVEKVLAEFMPSTKKLLTERKTMMPPYLMRDLAKLADHLYSTEKLVQGDPKTEVKEDKDAEDPLSYYT